MNKMELVVGNSKNKETVSIELRMNGKPLGHIYLPGAEAESHAQSVATFRARLNEEVSTELEPGARIETIVDPIWRTKDDHAHKDFGILLALRHPGLGWLSFLLPHKEAADLGQWLVDHSKPPLPDKQDS